MKFGSCLFQNLTYKHMSFHLLLYNLYNIYFYCIYLSNLVYLWSIPKPTGHFHDIQHTTYQSKKCAVCQAPAPSPGTRGLFTAPGNGGYAMAPRHSNVKIVPENFTHNRLNRSIFYTDMRLFRNYVMIIHHLTTSENSKRACRACIA